MSSLTPLKILRSRLALTQEQFAEKLGVSQARFSDMERGALTAEWIERLWADYSADLIVLGFGLSDLLRQGREDRERAASA